MTTLHNSLVGLETSDSRMALANAVKNKALILHEMVVSKGKEYDHSWSRPGLDIQTYDESDGLDYCVKLGHFGQQNFTLSTDPELSLATHATSPVSFYLVEFLLQASPLEQLQFMQDDANARAFVNAEKALSQAIDAITQNTPMADGLSWHAAFVLQLSNQCDWYVNAADWPRWLDRWGTPEMKQAMDTATSLVNPIDAYADWQALVLDAWRNPTFAAQVIPDNALDADLGQPNLK